MLLRAIWYYLYNLKNVKNTHGGVLLLGPGTLLKVILLYECFARFLNCANGAKSRKVPQLFVLVKYISLKYILEIYFTVSLLR